MVATLAVDEPGEALLEACRSVRSSAVLCAPFIKEGVLRDLLREIGGGVHLDVFTRWRPEEVAAGVSDPRAREVVEEMNGKMWICDSLHAKYFRLDGRILIGSANITRAGLGWSRSPNLEILSEVAVDEMSAASFESRLRNTSFLATEGVQEEVERLAALLPQPGHVRGELPRAESAGPWLPSLRDPSDLYFAYRRGTGGMTEISSEAATLDLEVLDLPPGLDSHQFRELVGSRLLQYPVTRSIDVFLAEPRRFGAVRDLICELTGYERSEAGRMWQTVMRWFLEFLPDRYNRSVPNVSEVLVRRRGVEGS